MGRRGPKPQPAVIQERKGNPGHRPIGSDPVSASVSGVAAIQPPKWLKKRGLQVWHRIAPRLISLKLLTFADTETFGRYCRNFGRWIAMEETLDREGEIYETETYLNSDQGEPPAAGSEAQPPAPQRANKLKRTHPAFLIADRLERQLLAAEDRFGLNPAERQRLFAARAQSADPAARDLFGADDGAKRPNDPAAKPAEPAQPIESPVGLLN